MRPTDVIQRFQPSRVLAGIVSHYEWVAFDERLNINSMANYPSFGQGLLFYFWRTTPILASSNFMRAEPLPRVLILCSLTCPVTSVALPKFDFLRVIFEPGMMSRVFPRVPMSAFHNGNTDAAVHLDRGLDDLYDQMTAVSSSIKSVLLLDKYLVKRCAWKDFRPAIFGAYREAANSRGEARVTVATVADSLGISRQYLNRLTKKELGYTAKETLRVIRFNSVLQDFHGNALISINETAHRRGYYDVPHLDHEFKTFSGCTPKAYLASLGVREVYGEEKDLLYSGFIEN